MPPLEIAPDERAVFLDQVSDGDAELRRELESLLAAESERLLPRNRRTT